MDKDTKNDLARTVTLVTSFTQWVSDLDDPDKMIPAICCGNKLVKSQCHKIVDDACHYRTGPSTADYIVDIVYSSFTEIFDMMCGKFPDENACTKHEPQLYKEVLLRLANPVVYNHTISVPLVKIIRQLDSKITINEG